MNEYSTALFYFLLGNITGASGMAFFRAWMLRQRWEVVTKPINVEDFLKVIIALVVTLVWGTILISVPPGDDIPLQLHLLMGLVVGAFFGDTIRKGGKDDK